MESRSFQNVRSKIPQSIESGPLYSFLFWKIKLISHPSSQISESPYLFALSPAPCLPFSKDVFSFLIFLSPFEIYSHYPGPSPFPCSVGLFQLFSDSSRLSFCRPLPCPAQLILMKHQFQQIALSTSPSLLNCPQSNTLNSFLCYISALPLDKRGNGSLESSTST